MSCSTDEGSGGLPVYGWNGLSAPQMGFSSAAHQTGVLAKYLVAIVGFALDWDVFEEPRDPGTE